MNKMFKINPAIGTSRTIFGVGLLFLLSACGFDPGSLPTSPSTQWSTYQNEDYKYSMNLAPGWQVLRSTGDWVAFSELERDSSARVINFHLGTMFDIDEIPEQLIELRQADPSAQFELISHTPITLDSGATGVVSEYRMQDANLGCKVHTIEVFLSWDSQVLQLEGSVCDQDFAKHQADLEAMLYSFGD